jgi:hypothetical protein
MDKTYATAGLVNLRGLREMGIDVAAQTLRDWEKVGRFPKRITINRCRVVWRIAEVEAWLEAFRRGEVRGAF